MKVKLRETEEMERRTFIDSLTIGLDQKRKWYGHDDPKGKSKKWSVPAQKIGIVLGTTPRVYTARDEIVQRMRHVRSADCQLERTIKRLSRCTSKQDDAISTDVSAGTRQPMEEWWAQAVPSVPSARDTPAHMKTDNGAIRDTFQKHRTRNRGVQSPLHP